LQRLVQEAPRNEHRAEAEARLRILPEAVPAPPAATEAKAPSSPGPGGTNPPPRSNLPEPQSSTPPRPSPTPSEAEPVKPAADVHHLLGLIYHQMGEFESALHALERAVEINPQYVEAVLNLAILCNDVGQYERAQQLYAQATEGARAGPRDALGDEPLDSFSRGKISNLHAQVGDGYMS